ncbi:YidC/Oxa1 family membrane protein insertase [Colwellia psychrerythraea]|uniref:60 kDa inner membrane insertion protein n=1 Tax=Colwellia psychrerythraea TaxID=28229 RepID=A0A099KJ69_COLPS|nr:YidC/Oxa1 family membrane protein insertase [Colwellia psychrerythraea]KGJ90884.1 60 kDa inner membrane insertion protein [Colwellia psychrerythraea]
MVVEAITSVISVYSNFFTSLAIVLGSYGLATILLSMLVSFLMTYPLRWANKIALREQEFQSVIAPQITKIQKESQGAEQHQRISALYARYSYHPIFATRLIIGVVIQLPVLVLTFFMFAHLEALNGQSFLFLKDLSQADNLLFGDGNLLPFVMTAVNLVAALFIPNFSHKNMMQAVLVSILFFILLYDAKSVLLLFWTMNNIILLGRNIFAYKQARVSERFNFSHSFFKLQLFMQRKEVFISCTIFFFYSLIAKSVFIKGYNLYLTNNIFRVSLLMLLGLVLFHLIQYFRGVWLRVNKINHKKLVVFLVVSKVDLLLVLFPLALIVQYSLINKELLTVTEQLQLIALASVFLFIFIVLIPLVLEKTLKARGLMPLNLALAVLYISMPTIVVMYTWSVKPDIALLAASFLVLFGFFYSLYLKKRKLLQALALVFFSLTSLYTGYLNYFSDDANISNPYFDNLTALDFSNFMPITAMKKNPDVYLLTYDGYVGQSTMQRYGIDNSTQEQFLLNTGFKIYPNTYSVAATSATSMSRVLEMSYKLIKPEFSSTAGNALVPAIFKKHGYKTHGVLSPYLLNSRVIGYDYSHPKIDNATLGMSSILAGLFEGQFRFDITNDLVDYNRVDWLEKKRGIFAAQTDYPKFMYSHTGPHHSQNSGKCLPNETELFAQRLLIANEEMVNDIKTILLSKRDAIIIINGDHGPYLTGDCLYLKKLHSDDITQFHLQDRVGTFLAIRWPDKGYLGIDNIRTLQDTFEVVFKYLFETEQVLHTRIPTSTLEIGTSFPKGMVKGGEITNGADKGKMLYNQ